MLRHPVMRRYAVIAASILPGDRCGRRHAWTHQLLSARSAINTNLPLIQLNNSMIYKICPLSIWREAECQGSFSGARIDRRDGYIHFSTAVQLRETAVRHFAGRDGLALVAVDESVLGPAFKWEPARDESLFPHLYGDLTLAAVRWTKPLPLGADGRHLFPDLSAETNGRV
jgi:uncharacterized protein (DUF952 family)